MHLFTNKAREKIYAHGIRCESKGTTKYPSSTKTIQAPYSQDNVAMFGLNAGTHCVAMSFASLTYNKRNGIAS